MDPQQTFEELTRSIKSLASYSSDIDSHWATKVDVTAPQWLILQSVAKLSAEAGTPVSSIASYLKVDPSFITTESKKLEKRGFLTRSISKNDGRVVLLKPSQVALRAIASLQSERDSLTEFLFAGFQEPELRDLLKVCRSLQKPFSRAVNFLVLND